MPRVRKNTVETPIVNQENGNGRVDSSQMLINAFTSRAQLLRKILDDSDRDIEKELGYPQSISPQQYQWMYERNEIAQRVVNFFPDNCWAVDPEIYDSDEQVGTPFEKKWKELDEDFSLLHYLHRVDRDSGIGRFGILLIGIDDGLGLEKPAKGLNEKGEKDESVEERKLLFVRSFPETLVEISKFEEDNKSPRYQQPKEYTIKFATESSESASTQPTQSVQVHWSRVIHVADGRGSSEVYGTPRMRPVYNRLLDLRKLLGGSAEMFWKGAFPGYSFEVNPEFVAQAGLDDTETGKAFKDAMRSEMYNYSEGLQRYLGLLGVNAKSLAPQVADPEKHVLMQFRSIAVSLGVPFRVFMGSEQGSLASSQDIRTVHKVLRRRNKQYVNPMELRPFVRRLVDLGVLPTPEEDRFKIYWPDFDTSTEQDKADVADKLTTAMQKYMTGQVEGFIPPMEYLTTFLGFGVDEATLLVEAAEKHRPEMEKRQMDQQEAQLKMQSKFAPPPGAGGANNMRKGKPAGGQNPKSPSKDRSRSGGSAGRST